MPHPQGNGKKVDTEVKKVDTKHERKSTRSDRSLSSRRAKSCCGLKLFRNNRFEFFIKLFPLKIYFRNPDPE